MKKIVSLINKEEGLKLETNIINLVIKKAQGDIRRCITLLEYIYRNKKKITSIENSIANNSANNSANNITMSIASSQNVNEDAKEDALNNDDICEDSTENIIENYSRKLTELAPYEMCEKVLNSVGTLDFFLENFFGFLFFLILFLFSDKVKKLAHNSSKTNLLKLFDKLLFASLVV